MQRVPKNDAFYDRADFPQGDGDGKENHNLYFISGVNTLNTLGSVKICVRQDLRATTQAFQATALRDVERTVRRRAYCREEAFNYQHLLQHALQHSQCADACLRAVAQPGTGQRSSAEACALPQKKVDEALLLIDNQIKPFTNNLKNITDPGYVPVHPKSFQLQSDILSACTELQCRSVAAAMFSSFQSSPRSQHSRAR